MSNKAIRRTNAQAAQSTPLVQREKKKIEAKSRDDAQGYALPNSHLPGLKWLKKFLIGYVSVVETLEQLYRWFTPDDILRLQERDWYITEYEVPSVEAEAAVYKWYDRFGHYAAAAATITKTRTIILTRTTLFNPVIESLAARDGPPK